MRSLRRAPSDDRSWRDVAMVALDFETTTADPDRAEPLSVGWVGLGDGRVRMAEAGYTLVDHRGEVPVESIRIHRLVPEELRAGVLPDELGDVLRGAVAERVLVAHGASLEQRLLDRWGVPYAASLDTLRIVRTLDRRAGRPTADARLPEAARRYGVPRLAAHQAFTDALTTALLLVSLAGRLEADRGRCTMSDLLLLSRD
ncbi:exonuclease domain-containing protein [Nocardioides sp.]|uniref:3'-5' exonuclease n=1 Tax=Nocardioides sp. TaxID=35761 RepID=UPI0035275EA1